MAKKPPGRPRGSQNKASKTLREALATLKFDLPDEFIKLYRDPSLELSAKLRLLTTLLEYTHPRLKEQEVPVAPPVPVTPALPDVPTDQLLTLVANGSEKS